SGRTVATGFGADGKPRVPRGGAPVVLGLGACRRHRGGDRRVPARRRGQAVAARTGGPGLDGGAFIAFIVRADVRGPDTPRKRNPVTSARYFLLGVTAKLLACPPRRRRRKAPRLPTSSVRDPARSSPRRERAHGRPSVASPIRRASRTPAARCAQRRLPVAVS